MSRLLPYLQALQDHYGVSRTPKPASPLEPYLRAILSQGASPKSLEKALHTLRVYGLLDLDRLRELDPTTIAMAIKPAGNAGAKAARIKTFVAWFADRFGADEDRLQSMPAHQLREELLGIGGVGPETDDRILQIGAGLPVAVVDPYTYRVFTRHELAIEEATYDDLKEQVEKGLPAEGYALFRALTDAVGREFCRPKAKCDDCPLRPLLPPGRRPSSAT